MWNQIERFSYRIKKSNHLRHRRNQEKKADQSIDMCSHIRLSVLGHAM